MNGPDGLEERTAELEEQIVDRDFDELVSDEPDDDYWERAAERADLDKQSFDQELRDAGRGHLVRS